MRFSFLKFNAARRTALIGRMARIREDDIIFSGVLVLAALLAALLAFDGWSFYAAVSRESISPPPSEKKARAQLSEQDIDGAIRLLDERRQRMNEILNSQ